MSHSAHGGRKALVGVGSLSNKFELIKLFSPQLTALRAGVRKRETGKHRKRERKRERL